MNRRHMLVSSALSVLAFAAELRAESAEEKGLRMAQMVHAADRGFVGERAKVTMVLMNGNGEVAERQMVVRVKEVEDDGDRSILDFESPKQLRGTRLLTWNHRTRDDDQWLYLSSVGRVKRITSSNKAGSFLGSEFTYEDLASQAVEKYAYRFVGDSTYEARPAWILERTPRIANSGYSKQLVTYDEEYKRPVRVDFFDLQGSLVKTATFVGYRQLQGRWWRPREVSMVNVQTKKRSVMTWNERQLGVTFAQREFESEALAD